jgi:PAS domain-containing protein
MTNEIEALPPRDIADIRSLEAAVIVLDPSGRVRLWNLAAGPIFGITAGDAANRVFAEIARGRLGAAVDHVLTALRSRRSLRTIASEGTLAVSVLPRHHDNVIVVRPAPAASPA